MERDTESLDVLLSWGFLDCVCDMSAGQENREVTTDARSSEGWLCLLWASGPEGTWQEAAALGGRTCLSVLPGEVQGCARLGGHTCRALDVVLSPHAHWLM